MSCGAKRAGSWDTSDSTMLYDERPNNWMNLTRPGSVTMVVEPRRLSRCWANIEVASSEDVEVSMSGKQAKSSSRLVIRMAEFRPKEDIKLLPGRRRGIYALFNHVRNTKRYDVVYVGLSRTSIRGRLKTHRKPKHKGTLWTHFSIFEVPRQVTDDRIAELEGLFRHIYRRDSRANSLNVQKTHRALVGVRNNDLASWK